MTSLWIIIRSDEYRGDDYDESFDPVVCGVYKTKEEAVGEILKLYIEDDIDMVYDPKKDNENTSESNEAFNYKPTVDILREQRRLLLDRSVWTTYSHRGNKYTLNECILGAKHKFDRDVIDLYKESREKNKTKKSKDKNTN